MGKNNRGNLEEEEFQNVIDKHTNEKADVTDIGEDLDNNELEAIIQSAERSYYDSVTLAKDGIKDCLKHYYEVFHTK